LGFCGRSAAQNFGDSPGQIVYQIGIIHPGRFARARRGDSIRVKVDLSAARLFDPHSKRVIKEKIEE